MKKSSRIHQNIKFSHIVGGGQTIGQLENGKKVFAWGVLPGEVADIKETKKKSHFIEGVVEKVHKSSPQRVEPRDPTSYLSTSPWQIMELETENNYKSALIEEAFELHSIVLPNPIDIYSDSIEYEYRNKIEYSWWWDKEQNRLDLAFFRRGTKGKIPIERTSIASPAITKAALKIRDIFRRRKVEAFDLKTLLIRSNREGEVCAQIYAKTEGVAPITEQEFKQMNIQGFELIYSYHKSPASIITKRLQSLGDTVLSDKILNINFHYATESFFQVNLPVYEKALKDMKEWIDNDKRAVDLYSGVGSIGLTIGGDNVTLVEINESAVKEMKRNISNQSNKNLRAILAASEDATEYITGDATIIVDPPRAGLHQKVIDKLLEQAPKRVVYLSCNPVTQARDVALLADTYGIKHHQGYNFFPHTPHIENLVILDKK